MKIKHKIKTVPAAKVGRQEPTGTQSADGVIPPSPEDLLMLASQETDRRSLDDYLAVITYLRNEKRFTFREIAHWLAKHGIKTDHNTIYRMYRKQLSPDEAKDLDTEVLHAEQTEQKG
jgi:hypothetical protein